jgi:hypothetical protein
MAFGGFFSLCHGRTLIQFGGVGGKKERKKERDEEKGKFYIS